MQQINQILKQNQGQLTANQPGQINSLINLQQKLKSGDVETLDIIKQKYASKQIRAMNEQELKLWPMALLIKIHVITGWIIPTDQILNVLQDQFQKKLIEDYADLNTDEIEFAFRKYGTQVEDWGKQMNLNMIDKVLLPFREKRIQASETEMKLLPEPVQRVYTESEIWNRRRGEMETAYQALRKGFFPIMFDYYAELLVMDGFITAADEMNQFISDKLNAGDENLYILLTDEDLNHE
jgi:hypothetical protein